MKCEQCGEPEGVKLEPSRTAYHVELECHHEDCATDPEMKALCYKARDPNKPIWLCRNCAVDYHDFWNERWAEYHASLL